MPSSVLAIGLFARLASVPLAYLLLWCGSLALSVTLIVLLRTRWGQSRPLHKCAVLSLLVHLLLACAMMTVRIVAGDGGGGAGPAIRVRIVQDSTDAAVLVDVFAELPSEIAPPLLEPPPEETQAPPPTDVQATVAKPADVPPVQEPLDAEPSPEAASKSSPANEPPAPDDTAKVAEVVETVASPPEPSNPSADVEPSVRANDIAAETAIASAAVASSQPEPSPAESPIALAATTPYSFRNAPGRLGLVEQQGGNGQTEAAVAAALRWLALAQSPDGHWDANEFGAGQEQMVLEQNRGGAGRNADTGMSALALLAFMGAGHSHLQGDYQDTVRRGLDFLLRSQSADGNLFGNATLYAQMYCHSMATFALAEALAMSGDRRLEPAVAKAVGYSLAAQSATTGGWRYRPGDSGDTSQLGWQMMALVSAQRAGINVPSHTWVRVERFLRSVGRGNYGGLASYRTDSPASTSMTAEALYCRLLVAEMNSDAIDDSAATEATAQLLAALPNAERVNLYYWYYATLALHHRQQRDDRAAAAWYAWNDAMTAAIVSTQATVGREAGSWNTNTVWGGYGGRVYTTAMAAMCLEVYYRYAQPQSRDRWTAARTDVQRPSR